MGKITKFESNTALKKQLPNSQDVIYMNALDGWEDISEEQRSFLSVYFDTYPKKMKACMHSGIHTGKYQEWLNSDSQFNTLMKLVEFIHLEELKDIEYAESYTDSKTRARFLKAMESGGYGTQKESTTNNLNIKVGGMNEARNLLDKLADED